MQNYFQVKQVSTGFLLSCLPLLPFCIVLAEHAGTQGNSCGSDCHTSWPLAGNCQVLCNVQLRQLWNCSYIQLCEIELQTALWQTIQNIVIYRKSWQILRKYSGTEVTLAEVSRMWTHVHQWVSLVPCVMCHSVTVSRLPGHLSSCHGDSCDYLQMSGIFGVKM